MAPLPLFIANSVTAVYNPCKDTISYLMGEKQDIKDLEDRTSDLTTLLTSIKSEKEKIDRALRNSVYTEKSDEYSTMVSNISVIHRKYIKFINKYKSISGNPLGLTTDESLISELGNLKSKILTFSFFKLANLSRDIAKLSARASAVLDRLKPVFMIQKKWELPQEKFDDNNNLPVFDTYVDKVLDFLCEKGNTVGIFGPIGVGKTTVLRKLYNHLIEYKSLCRGDNSFQLEYVIFTEYPAELETKEKIIEKLQNEIMWQLNIDHEASMSIQKNKNAISAFLDGKKYILLMDQVSHEVELGDLGLKEEYKKAVIASSVKKIISVMTDDVVYIERLGSDDGWRLFENIYGSLSDNRKKDIAVRIIECCAGIPWMIYHVAKHLKHKQHESSWDEVKWSLQFDSKSLVLMGLGGMDRVYTMMYEELGTDTKKCLLYGALFPNQHKIYRDYLIECWIAEGFLVTDSVTRKVRRGRDRGQSILDLLTDQHLLQWCSNKLYVQMPLNFRRVALELDYPDRTNCVTWAPSDDLEPNDDTWTRVTRMSLIGCNTKLPESPECSNIYTLLLQSLKPHLERLTDVFFHYMKILQVLDLSRTEIRSLPCSISCLESLKSLYLNDCNRLLSLPPEAAELKKLEFLDISETSISSLPREIRGMLDLRFLRASLSPNSKRNEVNGLQLDIPLDIINRLSKLEELSINTSLVNDSAEKLATELASLGNLNTLCFNFPNVSSVDTFVNQSNSLKNKTTSWGTRTFRSYRIFIGSHEVRQHPHELIFSGILSERWLRYSTHEKFSTACEELLQQASAFELIGHDDVRSLSQFDLHSLKACVVGSCNKMEHFLDGNIAIEEANFVQRLPLNLEKLYLYDLKMLECICKEHVPSQSFTKLTAITINGCPKLRKILDHALACELQSLEYLRVEKCSETLEIVEVLEGSSNSNQRDSSVILRSLKTIKLSDLPELQTICTSNSMSWKSLNSIIVKRCSKLRNLSLTSTNAKKLTLIQCEQNWWDSLQLPDELNKGLHPFCHFKE